LKLFIKMEETNKLESEGESELQSIKFKDINGKILNKLIFLYA